METVGDRSRDGWTVDLVMWSIVDWTMEREDTWARRRVEQMSRGEAKNNKRHTCRNE